MRSSPEFPTLREFLRDQYGPDASQDDIDNAKKTYKKVYNRIYKRKRRKEQIEFTSRFSPGEAREIRLKAKTEGVSVPTLIQNLVLRFLGKPGVQEPLHKAIREALLVLSKCYELMKDSHILVQKGGESIQNHLSLLMARILQMEVTLHDLSRHVDPQSQDQEIKTLGKGTP